MDTTIVALYVIIDEFLTYMGYRDDPRARMSGAEVLLTAIVAMLYFHGVIERARIFLQEYGYIPHMLSKSRLNRRLHRLRPWLDMLVDLLAEVWIHLATEEDPTELALDTFPVPVCDNIRIARCRLFQDSIYRGYVPSKRRYYYGLKLHLLVDRKGHILHFFFTPASVADVAMLPAFPWEQLPEGSITYADKAYNHYAFEDFLHTTNRTLLPVRKRNSKRPLPPWLRSWQHKVRKRVETTASRLFNLWPRHLHAVTPSGFLLKASCFVLALSLYDLTRLVI